MNYLFAVKYFKTYFTENSIQEMHCRPASFSSTWFYQAHLHLSGNRGNRIHNLHPRALPLSASVGLPLTYSVVQNGWCLETIINTQDSGLLYNLWYREDLSEYLKWLTGLPKLAQMKSLLYWISGAQGMFRTGNHSVQYCDDGFVSLYICQNP